MFESMRRIRAVIQALPALSALALACGAVGCAPNIHSFRAEPNVSCGGSPVTLTWSASAGGALSSVPSDPSLGDVEASGSKVVKPAAKTRYRLDAKHFGRTTSREIDVEVLAAPTDPTTIGASVADPSTTCADGKVALVVTAPPNAWDPRILVARVRIPSRVNRPYHVEHEGRSADVVPGADSTAFQGLPLQGAWRFSTALQGSEACGSNVPRSLLLDVYSICSQ